MKKPRVIFVPADNANLPFVHQLQNSLRKFHTEEELPLIRFDNPNPNDKDFFYRATPIIAQQLLKEYEVVIKMDADSIVTGDLSHLWEGEFDVAVVQNSNPREFKTYPYQFMNIPPLDYFNCGLVVMKSEAFVDHWLKLCYSPIFYACQMREQDLLNILCRANFNVKALDASDNWHGLVHKGFWPQVELRAAKEKPHLDELILPKNDEWGMDGDKSIRVIHFAGGADPNKGKLKLYFKPEVVKHLEELIK